MRDQGLTGRAALVALPTVAGGLALALLVSADAGADTVLVADRAESAIPAHLDLTGARYVIDLDGFSARLTVRDLVRRAETVGFTLTFGRSGHSYHVTATRSKAGKQTYKVARDLADGQLRRTCSTFVATWDDSTDRIDVHVPWSCLGEERTGMKVFGSLAAGKGREPSDSLKTVRVRYR